MLFRSLHFGDFDPAGISIFVNEYWKKLGDKANFFIPENIKDIFISYGNRSRYDHQEFCFNLDSIDDSYLLGLIELIEKEQKGVDQEVLIVL